MGGVVNCCIEPGDAVFVHGTTLHMSEGNLSDRRRLAFAAHFTRAHNEQFVDPYSTGLVRTAFESNDCATSVWAQQFLIAAESICSNIAEPYH